MMAHECARYGGLRRGAAGIGAGGTPTSNAYQNASVQNVIDTLRSCPGTPTSEIIANASSIPRTVHAAGGDEARRLRTKAAKPTTHAIQPRLPRRPSSAS